MDIHPNTNKCLNKLGSLVDKDKMKDFIDFEINQIYLGKRDSTEDLAGYQNDLLYIQSILADKPVCRLESDYSTGRFEDIRIKLNAILNPII